MINFSQKMENWDLVVKLSEHIDSDRALGMGTFDLRPIKIKYMEHSQRFYSMLEIDLASKDGEAQISQEYFCGERSTSTLTLHTTVQRERKSSSAHSQKHKKY